MPKIELGHGDLLRIMLMSAPGGGKTYAWLKYVETYAKMILDGKITIPQAPKFYILDPDAGVEEDLNEFKPEVVDVMLKLIDYYLVSNWNDVKSSFEQIRVKVQRGDVVVLEQSGQIWDMIQSHYVKEVFKDDLGEYFIHVRKQLLEQKAKNTQAKFDGWKDWSVIKKAHNTDFLEVLTKRVGCKVIITASLKDPQENEDKEITEIFGDLKVRPEGEKHNPYRVDVILLLGKNKEGHYWVRTANKIRGMAPFNELISPGKGALEVYFEKREQATGKPQYQPKQVGTVVSPTVTPQPSQSTPSGDGKVDEF